MHYVRDPVKILVSGMGGVSDTKCPSPFIIVYIFQNLYRGNPKVIRDKPAY